MLDRLLSRVLAWSERLLRIHWIAEAKAVVDADGQAGGSLLAAGLAYRALFGLLSGLILVAGLIGWVVRRRRRRGRRPWPPSSGSCPDSSRSSRRDWRAWSPSAATLSILGLVGAAFGASIFYDALDDSMNRVMPGGGQRNPILRRLLGVAAVDPAGPRRRRRARHRAGHQPDRR